MGGKQRQTDFMPARLGTAPSDKTLSWIQDGLTPRLDRPSIPAGYSAKFACGIPSMHPWRVTYHQAVRIQEELRLKLDLRPFRGQPRLVAGTDVSFSKSSPELYAGVVVLSFPDLELVESCAVKGRASFPYIPGLLSFREIPVLLKAFGALKNRPDVVICDGQGIAHPRGFGLAAHLGVILGMPSIGCAKNLLVGDFAPPAARRWASSRLVFEGREVGRVLRTRDGVKPVFVSPGHLMDIPGAERIVRRCCTRFRLPETTRQAHLLVNRRRREERG